MHSFLSSSRKLLALTCVLLVCASVGSARSRKSSHRSSSKAAVSSTASHKSASAKSRTKTGARSSTTRSTKGKKRGSRAGASRSRGQQAISDDRATEIQQALIRAKYLDGEPSGVWDGQTRSAMAKFQADNGWQSKVVPDSRALIKLGLGPNHSDVINPETSLMLPHTTDTARQLLPGGATPQR